MRRTLLSSLLIASASRAFRPTSTRMTGTSSLAAGERPFGAWESPITSKSITAGSVKLGGLHVCQGNLFWLEGRPQEGGRNVVCRYAPESSDRNERNAVDVTPKDSNVRTRVHEYGGGAVTMGETNGELFFSEFATQQLCLLADDGKAEPITPEGDRFRFADGILEDISQLIYCIREDHQNPAPKDVVNEVVAVSVDGSETTKTMATGNDFYAAPRLSPDGKKLAYITWNHPNMPWDATELRVTSTDAPSTKSSDHELIAGSDGDTSIMQPLWHPQTGDLFYISDQSGFYNIYRAGYEENTSILPMDTDFGGAAPGWSLGQQGFSFLPDGRLVAQYKKDGQSVLIVANVSGDGPATDIQEYGVQDGLPMMFGGVIGTEESKDLYFIGGSPSTALSVYKWNLEEKGLAEILACSSTLAFSDDIISVPTQVEFPTTLGTAYGYYYAPKNGGFQCTTEKAPPLLVKAHGGPTACTGTSFNAGIQFWTSRGFAVLDVDYGGSTGYGREYRRRLRKSWGIVDIDDVCAGAQYLVKEGLADGDRLCIDGGSAGGYTTLGALAFRDVFKAGCSLYGIGDLTALAGDTHKFESRYLDGLVGPYPEDEAIYKERSPIESVDTLSCPILILQGEEDKIVPPNQARMMHEALLKKNIPTCLKIYEGEQHGFRKAENIEDALDSELAFYGKVYGIDIPGAVDIKIDNM
jgi:dipeptidyl aminopeptidase/acylaminoacyl peptidase